jgi:hypothetical protein
VNAAALRLRPHPYLLRRGIGAALAFFVPAIGALLFLTIPSGPWPAVLIATVVVMLALAYSIVSYVRLGVWVTADSVAERGFFGITRRHTPATLGTAVFVRTYHGGGVETLPQLFLCDPAGTQVIRLRGQFWSLEAMQIVMATLDISTTEIDQPMSVAELHARYPGLLYWFERRPVLFSLIFAGILVVGGGLLYALLVALGATF